MSRHQTILRSGLSLVALALTTAAVGCLAEPSSEEPVSDQIASALCTGYPQWQQGASYHTGDIVIFNGSPYIAEHDNPGYDPTISTWFWDPYTGCSGGTTTGGGGTCNYPQWQQGASYHTGDIIIFNGSPYIAEHDNPGYDPTVSTWFWDPYTGCSGGTTGTGGGTTGGSGFGEILTESVFKTMFPSRNGFYTYQALISAAATFPELATTGDITTRKREVAAFLANVNHETGGLVYVEEINKALYCDTSWGPPGCGCAAGKSYYGRGPLQLSWNGNYCAAGNALGLPLKSDPDLVARDAVASWRTGFWFWTTQTGAGSMTPHNAIVTGAGFGQTIRSINGALECNGKNPAQVQSRVDAYLRFTNLLGVSPGSNTGC